MPRWALFLDDGNVLNDNAVRGQQWQRLVGEFFSPRLGGTAAAWAEANGVVATQLLAPAAWQARMAAAHDYASFDWAYQRDWLHGMCRRLAIDPPSDETSVALARQATAWLIPQVRAAAPGAVDAVRLLHQRGYTLHTASGASSTDLELYLTGMDVRTCFGRLYGPDVVGAFKDGPRFYERILDDAGVAATDAVVVDDNAIVLGWAAQVGARTVLVGRQRQRDGFVGQHIASLAALPGLMEQWEGHT